MHDRALGIPPPVNDEEEEFKEEQYNSQYQKAKFDLAKELAKVDQELLID
jgi:hypothetical protein